MPIDVTVAVLPGVSEASLAVTTFAFSTANRVAKSVLHRAPPFRVTIAAPTGGRVACSGGMSVSAVKLEQAKPAVIIVPGMGAASGAELDALLARADAKKLGGWLQSHARRSIASSCSGVFLLAAAGLLDGHRATTTWWLAPVLAARFPRVTVELSAMVVPDRQRLTAGASMAAIDLMIHLIAAQSSPELASLISRFLVVDERPSQARYVVPSLLAVEAPEVQAAERWVRAHLAEPFTLAELARALGVGLRTLARRFDAATGTTPHAFIRSLRLEAARHLLETTRLSVEEVAARVGFGDPATLRRAFKRVGQTPREVRAGAHPMGSVLERV